MNKVGPIQFKKIKRISPSQFYSMKSCAYKSLLSEAFGKKPLLPISPNAYLGTALHKVLERISKGEVQNDEDFKLILHNEIALIEKSLTQQGYDYFTPLQKNTRDFGIKVVLLKKHLRTSTQRGGSLNKVSFDSEKWFESKDGLVGGRIDLVIEDGDEIEIVDFKTGAIKQDILDDNGEIFYEIKKVYQDQLKIYAYLFFDSMGKFPTKLSLIDLDKQKFTVEFTKDECKNIFEEAEKLLDEINSSITSGAFSANPNDDNCKYCLYRPACSYYLDYLRASNTTNDVCGLVTNVVQYRNGNVTLVIEQGNNTVSITGFAATYFEYFQQKVNTQINLFNLKKESVEFVYSMTKTTKIYEP